MKGSSKVAVVVVLALLAVPALALQQGDLVASLEVGKYRHAACDDIAMTFSMTNTTGQPVQVLRWLTPLQGISGDILQVQRDGEAVPYVGRVYKWAAPTAADFIVINPGETRSVTFDPSAVYDMSVTGQYTVRYRAFVQDPGVDDGQLAVMSTRPVEPLTIQSNNVALWMEGREPVAPHQGFEDSMSAAPVRDINGIGGYTGCSTSRKNSLVTAHANAGTMSTKAYTWLVNNPSGGTLYTTWFGAYTSSRFSTVKSHYTNLKSTFATKTFTFDCTCTDSAYAYVYPSQPYKIYLCSAFWSAPATGRDSKAGTLVHETSHFTVVAGTQDYVYGATGAKNLAKTTPTKAINNADNHEYFAEDQP
jgi:peptidyl-Lys metalloendopeptidase